MCRGDTARLIDRGVPLIQGWGMTETSPGGTLLDAADVMRKIGSAGKQLAAAYPSKDHR